MPAIGVAQLRRGWSRRPNEVDPFLREQPLAVPDAALDVQKSEARQIPRIRVDLAAHDEIPETIHAEKRVPHAYAIEQGPPRELQICLVAAESQLHSVDSEQGVIVLVVEVCAGSLINARLRAPWTELAPAQ